MSPAKRTKKRTKPRREQEPARSGLWERVLATAEREEPGDARGLIRLNLYMARCGVASRRASDALIAEGRVQVNGKIVRKLGTKIDPLRDRIVVDDRVLKPEKPTYVLLHKPAGVVCTSYDREKRPRAIDLVDRVRGRLFTVGRLDAESEGLLILTNDGRFADCMTHPRYGVPKTYHVTLRGRIEPEHSEKARGGVWLAEGKTQGVAIRIRRRTRERSYLEVSLREGRNREVRRIFARLGYPVLRLKRIRIGALGIRGIGRGRYRFLGPPEVRALLAAANEGRVRGGEATKKGSR